MPGGGVLLPPSTRVWCNARAPLEWVILRGGADTSTTTLQVQVGCLRFVFKNTSKIFLCLSAELTQMTPKPKRSSQPFFSQQKEVTGQQVGKNFVAQWQQADYDSI